MEYVRCNVSELIRAFDDKVKHQTPPSLALVQALAETCIVEQTEPTSAFERLVLSHNPVTQGERLRAARLTRKRPIRELTHLISEGYISEFETGKRGNMSRVKLSALCNELRIRIEWVMYGELPIEPTA